MKSRGSVEFKAMGVKLAEWERRLKSKGIRAADSTISAWQSGTRTVPVDVRELIHSEWNGPHPDAWEDYTVSEPAPLPDVPLEDATPERVADAAARLLRSVRQLQQELDASRETGEGLGARLRMAESIAGVLGKLGSMTGTKLTERMILESPKLKEIIAAGVDALESWPDAMRAFASALERFHVT